MEHRLTRLAGLVAAGTVATVLAGCTTAETGREAIEAAKPVAEPARTLTSLQPALSCMHDMLRHAHVTGISIGVLPVTDGTGLLTAGGTTMLLSALSDLSRSNGAIQVSRIDPMAWEMRHAPPGGWPDFLFTGEITQVDKGVVRENAGATIGVDPVSVGGQLSRNADLIALDLLLLRGQSGYYVTDAKTANTLAVQRRSRGGSIGASISSVGSRLSYEFQLSEGQHQALRTLVELGAIEAIGKLAGLPYQDCLQPEPPRRADSPDSVPESSELYKELARLGKLDGLGSYASRRQDRISSERARVFQVQNLLRSLGLRDEPPTEVFDGDTAGQLKVFAQRFDVPFDGRLTDSLVQSLERAVAGEATQAEPAPQAKPVRKRRFD